MTRWFPITGSVYNAFCPTGEGGGQDNSCAPGKGGSGIDREKAVASVKLKAQKQERGQGVTKETIHTISIGDQHVATITEGLRSVGMEHGGGLVKTISMKYLVGSQKGRYRGFSSVSSAKHALRNYAVDEKL